MKFIIKWNVGHGESAEVVEVDSQDEAERMAYEAWQNEAESNADYSAEAYTKEEAENYGIEED